MRNSKKHMSVWTIVVFLSIIYTLFGCAGNGKDIVETTQDYPGPGIRKDSWPRGELPPPLPREKSIDIGKIPAYFHVGNNGSANYTIPIEVLPGRGGIQPRLSLSYNSLGGMSFTGIRFSLNGLSSISRQGSSYTQDGWIESVNFDADDHFVLDGNRLVEIEGNSGDNNTEYRTRRDVFSRIISHVSPDERDNGPEYFTVYSKEGLILTYGQNGSIGATAVLHARDGIRQKWALSKVEDRFGNYMLFYYLRETNFFLEDTDGDGIAAEMLGPVNREQTEMIPSIILYTGNEVTGARPQRWVKFTYDDLNNKRYGYKSRTRYSSTKLLIKIRVGIGNLVGGDNDVNMVKKYELEYHRSGVGFFREQPYLISITEKDKDNIAKPPTRFEWEGRVNGFTRRHFSSFEAPLTIGSLGDTDDWRAFNRLIAIDVNNDGFSDLMYPSARGGRDSTWRILLNGGEGYFEEHGEYFSEEIDTEVPSNEPTTDWGSIITYPLARAMDYDQDGFTDLLLINGSSNWEVLRNNGTSEAPFFDERIYDTGIPSIEPSPGSYFTYTSERDFRLFKAFYTYLIDVNADNRKDLVYYEVIGSESDPGNMYRAWRYRIHTGEGFGTKENMTTLDLDRVSNPVKPIFLDCDGDGGMEVLIQYGGPGGTYTRFSFTDGGPPLSYYYTNLPFFHTQMYQDFSGEFHGDNIGATFVMDINGDGLKDILFIKNTLSVHDLDGRHWYPNFLEPKMWFNTGRGFIGGSDGLGAFFPRISFAGYNYSQATIIDYNLDGRDDLLVPYWGDQDNDTNRGDAWQAVKWDVILASNISNFDGTEVGFQRITTINPMEPIVRGYNNNNIPTVLDLNGDFLPDFLFIHEEQFVMSVQRKDPPFVVKKIRDGMIGIDETHPHWDDTWTVLIEYEPTTTVDVYEDHYPDGDLPEGVTIPTPTEGTRQARPSMNVVSYYALDNGIEKPPLAYRLKYFDSRFDYHWGWLGFGQIKYEEVLTGITETKTMDNYTREDRLMVRHLPNGYFPYHGFTIFEWSKANLSDGKTYLSLRHNKYERRELGRKRYFSFLRSQDRALYYSSDDSPYQRIRSLSFNARSVNDHGEVVRAVVDLGEGADQNQKTIFTEFDDDESEWLIARPHRHYVTWRDSGGDLRARHWEYTYVTNTKQVETYTRSPSDDTYKHEITNVYDDYGNIILRQMQARNRDGHFETKHVTNYGYDSENIFLSWIEKPYSLIQEVSHNPEGLIEVLRAFNGEVTRVGYDGFNRLRRIEYPTGLVHTVEQETRAIGDTLGDSYRGHSRIRVTKSLNSGESETITYDRLGRPVHFGGVGFDGTRVNGSIRYNEYGRLAKATFPRLVESGSNPYLEYSYDALRRITTIENNNWHATAIEYKGAETVVTDPKGNITTFRFNTWGQLDNVEDQLRGEVTYQYGHFGKLKKIIDANGKEFKYNRDLYGRLISYQDPSLFHSYHYEHDGFDQLTFSGMRGWGESIYDYDLIGRPIRISGDHMTTEFGYDDPASHTYGRVHEMTVSGSWNNEKAYSYNAQGLLEEITTNVEGRTFINQFEYDDFGRIERRHYPKGPVYISSDWWGRFDLIRKNVGLRYHYNEYGYLTAISDLDNTLQYLTVEGVDGGDRLTEFTYGNGITTTRDYDVLSGQITSIESAVQDLHYYYDSNSNLWSREDNVERMREDFVYDELNRLRTVTTNLFGETVTNEFDYDISGNILFKKDKGNYVYDYTSSQPYTLREIEQPDGGSETFLYNTRGNQSRSPECRMEYTSFNKPYQIEIPGLREEIELEYDGNMNRIVKRRSGGQTIYVGDFILYENSLGEKTYYYYLPNGLIKIGEPVRGRLPEEIHYFHYDHLGSIHQITDDVGTVENTVYFDAFGQARSHSWVGRPQSMSDLGLHFGYTGHEHDEDFELNLINMGGRIYDSGRGRFLNSDIARQYPTNSQNYGPYSYVLNNPLTLTDPSGYEVGEEYVPPWIPPQYLSMNIPSQQVRELFHPTPTNNWDGKIDAFSNFSIDGGPELMAAFDNSISTQMPEDPFESLLTPRPFTETGFHGSPSRVVDISLEDQERGIRDISIMLLGEGLFPVAYVGGAAVLGPVRNRVGGAIWSVVKNTPLRNYSRRYWQETADGMEIVHQVVVGTDDVGTRELAAILGEGAPEHLALANLSRADRLSIAGHHEGIMIAGELYPTVPGLAQIGGHSLTGAQLGALLRARGFRGQQIDLYICSAGSTGLQHELAMSLPGTAVRAAYGRVRTFPFMNQSKISVVWGPNSRGPALLDDEMWSTIQFFW